MKKKYAPAASVSKKTASKEENASVSAGVGLAAALTLPSPQTNASTLNATVHRPMTAKEEVAGENEEAAEDSIESLEATVASLRAKMVENQAIFRQDNLNTLRENQSMIKYASSSLV